MKNLLVTSFILFLSISLSAQCGSIDEEFDNPGVHNYTLPGSNSDSYTIEITAIGADGGDGNLNGSTPNGGEGATMKATFDVVGGDELMIVVGESGFSPIGNPGGGGGGGGTAVVINNESVLIVAAAGGGAGHTVVGLGAQANTDSSAAGGSALGSSGGGGFEDDGEDGVNSTGGGAGTLTDMGDGGSQGVVAGPGGDGFGGGGGGAGTVGGGGGGYLGGDGPPSGAGMGGDSFVNSGFNSDVLENTDGGDGDGDLNDGYVQIVCIGGVDNLSISIVEIIHVSCNGGNNGYIEIEAIGGLAPYTYSIDGGPEVGSGEFSDLEAGTYELEVFDDMGNSASVEIEIEEPDELTLETESTDISCFGENDGQITAEADGGTPDYMYFINGDGPFDDGDFEDLEAGDYDISIEDENGCIVEETITLSEPQEMFIDEITITAVSCFGEADGMIDFVVFGGLDPFVYVLNGQPYNELPIMGLEAGHYDLIVEGDDFCTVDFDFEILSPVELILEVDELIDASCANSNGGSVILEADGGTDPYEYTLGNESNSDGEFEDLDAGDHIATVVDENGCMAEVSFTIAIDVMIDAIYDIIEPSCNGEATGEISVLVDGGNDGYSFTLNGEDLGTSVFTDLTAGVYIVQITNEDGCSTQTTIELQEPEPLVLTLIDYLDPICEDDSTGVLIFEISGGNPDYQILVGEDTLFSNGGAITIMDLPAGDYVIEVLDESSCFYQETISLVPTSTLMLESLEVVNADCLLGENGSLSILASGGMGDLIYVLDTMENDSGIFEDLEPGSYSGEVVDAAGCNIDFEIDILLEGDITGLIESIQHISCFGEVDGMIEVTAEGGSGNYVYALDTMSNMDGVFTNLAAGMYSVIIIDELNCQGVLELEILGVSEELTLDLLDFVPDDGSMNGIINVSVNGGTNPYQFSINDGLSFQESSTFEGLSNAVYSIIVQDANGCEDTLTVVLTSEKDINIEKTYVVYPVPSKIGNQLKIESTEVIERIILTDSNGKIVRILEPKAYKLIFDPEVNESGLYFLMIKTISHQKWSKVLFVE